jgi:transcription initiation factor IIE alpha subunit
VIVFVVNTTITEKTTGTLRHLPPSAKLVYKVLETGGLLTQKDLIRETSLPSRTVRYAINRLKDEQFLIERHYFIDARQSLYGLNRPKQEVIAA